MRAVVYGFESRSEREFFSGLCSSSVTAELALMTVITSMNCLLNDSSVTYMIWCIIYYVNIQLSLVSLSPVSLISAR